MLINSLRTFLRMRKVSQMMLTRFQWGVWQCQGTSLTEYLSQVPIGQRKQNKNKTV